MFEFDRLRAAIEAVIKAMGPNPVYLAAWPAVIVSWNDSAQLAQLQVQGVTPLPAALRNVPALVDPPGTRVTFAEGTSVLVQFRGGDPSDPYFRPATAFGQGGFVPTEIRIASGTQAAARVGDTAGPYVITTGSSVVKIG